MTTHSESSLDRYTSLCSDAVLISRTFHDDTQIWICNYRSVIEPNNQKLVV